MRDARSATVATALAAVAAEQPRVLLRQHRPARRAAHGRQHGHRLAEPHHAAHDRDAPQRLPSGQPDLGPGHDAEAAALVAHRGGPVAVALQKDSVSQGHTAELHRHRLLGKKGHAP